MAVSGARNNFEGEHRLERRDNILDETQTSQDTNEQARMLSVDDIPEDTTYGSTDELCRRLGAENAKSVTIPRIILAVFAGVVIVFFFVSVALLTLILFKIRPQNVSPSRSLTTDQLVSEMLKDLNTNESRLLLEVTILEELAEIKEAVTVLRKNVTAGAKDMLSEVKTPLKELNEDVNSFRGNITSILSGNILFSNVTDSLTELTNALKTLRERVTAVLIKNRKSLADIKEDIKEIKKTLSSRANETSCCFGVTILYLSLFLLVYQITVAMVT
ncbi:uncharacterized protein [Montipora foliosa]|uniref:uncharacterized protein n=1 Tax=Montipora foliosa TaxID=591990 RepID=UPI0035F1A6F8